MTERRRTVQYALRSAVTDADESEHRIEERHQRMGTIKRVLHDTGIWHDKELVARTQLWQREKRRVERQGTKLKLIDDRLETWEARKAEELESVRPEAEHELQRRQTISENARAQLKEIQQAELRERQQERQARRLRL